MGINHAEVSKGHKCLAQEVASWEMVPETKIFAFVSLCLEKGTGASLVWKLFKKKERNLVMRTGYRMLSK